MFKRALGHYFLLKCLAVAGWLLLPMNLHPQMRPASHRSGIDRREVVAFPVTPKPSPPNSPRKRPASKRASSSMSRRQRSASGLGPQGDGFPQRQGVDDVKTPMEQQPHMGQVGISIRVPCDDH